MRKYIDAEKLIAEIKRLDKENKELLKSGGSIGREFLFWIGAGYADIIKIVASLQQEQPEVNEVEKALSLQIQAYLTTASDELYAPGKPLYTEAHHKGIHECMLMWQKLHQYYFSTMQEQPEENKLPNKRTRVNYAICKLQSFKPLRETIVLDGYVYDEGKCYRENLLNYINAIPESRLTEIRSYLKEKGWWPYGDDTDWMEKGQPEADWEKEINDYMEEHHLQMLDGGIRYDTGKKTTTA